MAAAARSLAIELAPDVLVNVVVPGQFDTGALARAQAARAAAEGATTEAVRDRHRAVHSRRALRPSLGGWPTW